MAGGINGHATANTTNTSLETVHDDLTETNTELEAVNTKLDAANTKLQAIADNTDTLEVNVAAVNVNTDALEALTGTGNTSLVQIRSDTTQLHTDNGDVGSVPPSLNGVGASGILGYLRNLLDKAITISSLVGALPTDVLTNTQLRATAVPTTDSAAQAKLTTVQNQLEQPLTTASTATPLTSGNVILPAMLCTGSFAVVYFYRTAAASNAQVRIQFSPNGVDNWVTGGRLSMTSVSDIYSFADITSSTAPVVSPVIGKYIRLIAGTSFTGVGTLESAVFFTNADPMGGAPRPVSQSGTWPVTQGAGAAVSPWRVAGVAPQTTLNSVTTNTNGSSADVIAACNGTFAVHFSGTVSACTLTFQGSMDGTNWFTLATAATTTDYVQLAPAGSSWRFWRANTSGLTGAGATVLVIFCAGA